MDNLKKYLSLVKFSHTVFALPFAIIGYTIGITEPDAAFKWYTFLLVILCMVFARNAAMGFNRWADAAIDASNPRTAVRDIPAGNISKPGTLWFVIINSIAFIICTFFFNPLCAALSIPFLLVILGYSYTKRFTSLSHFVLGFGLALAPIGAYLTVNPTWRGTLLYLSLIVFTWVSGFDIIYSCQDASFDKENRLHSVPSLVGIKRALQISIGLHLLSILFLVLLGLREGYSYSYWIGASIFAVLLIYQHSLVKENDLSKVNLAFFTTNGIGSVLFGTFYLIELLFFN